MAKKKKPTYQTWQPERVPLFKRLFNFWTLSTALAVAAMVAIFFLYAYPSRQAALHLAAGLTCYQQKDYPCALGNYTRSIEYNPDNPVAYLHRGTTRVKAGRYQDAIADLNYALQLAPESAQLLTLIGDAQTALGKYPDALSYYSQAIAHNPSDAIAYIKRGAVKATLEQWPEALADYGRAQQLNPRNPAIYINRGIVRQKLNLTDEAIQDFSEALRLGEEASDSLDEDEFGSLLPGFSEFDTSGGSGSSSTEDWVRRWRSDVYFRRGYLQHTLGKWPEAAEDYDIAIRLTPNRADIHYACSIVYQHLRQYSQSRACRKKALELDPDLLKKQGN